MSFVRAAGAALRRVVAWSMFVGGVSFAAGFFGPMILAPDANQGPLLGIFITGPLGLVAGFGVGVLREWMGRTATPREILADWRDERRRRRPVPDAGARREPGHRVEARPVGGRGVRVLEGHPAGRALAGIGGFVLLVEALRRWPEGVDRGVAGSLVVAAALLWYAARGRLPAWFGR